MSSAPTSTDKQAFMTPAQVAARLRLDGGLENDVSFLEG